MSRSVGFLVVLSLLTGCSAHMVVPAGSNQPPAYAPLNETARPGIVKYLNAGAPAIIEARRDDAYRQMYTHCTGRYRILAEGTSNDGGSAIYWGYGIATFHANQWVYIRFVCEPPEGRSREALEGHASLPAPDRRVAPFEAQAQRPAPEQAVPQCTDATVRAQCPLYQYRTGIYRGRCQDGSGVEVGPDYVKVLPPEMGRPPQPWQADRCSVATPS